MRDLSVYVGNKIKLFRESRGMTQSDLAEKLNTSRQSISRYETGERKANQDILFELSEVLGVNISDFFPTNTKTSSLNLIYDRLIEPRQKKVYKYAEQQLKEQNKVISIEETQTVYLNSKLSAGTGILDLDPTDTKEIEYLGYVPKHDLAFKVCGDSMTPSFKDGEIVFVEKTPDIHNGQFIAVQINEEAFLKKAYKEEDCLRLVSLNDKYEDIVTCNGDDIRVIGRVIL